MLLEAILKDLQLTHKSKPVASGSGYGVQEAGMAKLDQLEKAVRNHYQSFLGFAWFGEDNWVDIGGDKHAKRVRLDSGDNSDFGNDTSEADYALACDLLQDGFNPGDVEIIMRATRYRAKFDEMRGSTTYLARTLNNAMTSVAQGISTPPTEQPAFSLEQGRIRIPTTPPAPRNYVWQGRIVAGHAYALGGFGGVSKSQAALQLAASVALGIPFGGVTTKKGSALLIFGEDDASEITRRIGAYAAHENLSASQRSELEKNIRALCMVGEETRLTATRGGTLESTAFSGEIITATAELVEQSGEQIRLIVLDHAGLFHGGDFNAREDVSLTMRIVNHIAHVTGAAVLLLAHSPKAAGVSETSDASAIAGSTAFVDQTRGALILATMRPKEAKALGIPDDMRQQYVSLAIVKNNYGITGEVSWFTRTSPPGWEVGVLVPVALHPPVKSATPNAAVADRVKQFIADHPGQYSKTSLREKRSGKSGELKASKPEVAAAIEDLLATGELLTREPTPDERKKFDLSQQAKAVLAVYIKGELR
ncbi:MAG: AAA family ATPase [Gallionella sp.]|nr:AAA family ATPase [Gallionella sp.]